jgi:hypothetical protein
MRGGALAVDVVDAGSRIGVAPADLSEAVVTVAGHGVALARAPVLARILAHADGPPYGNDRVGGGAHAIRAGMARQSCG